MFNKNRDINKSIRIDTLIGQNTHINGDISFNGGLRIDGSIAGNINATGVTADSVSAKTTAAALINSTLLNKKTEQWYHCSVNNLNPFIICIDYLGLDI